MNAKIDNNNMYFECEGHDLEGLRICVSPFYKDEDTEVYLYGTTANFDNLQHKWFHKLKMIINIILGKEFYFHQVILTKDDVKTMGKFLSNIKFKED